MTLKVIRAFYLHHPEEGYKVILSDKEIFSERDVLYNFPLGNRLANIQNTNLSQGDKFSILSSLRTHSTNYVGFAKGMVEISLMPGRKVKVPYIQYFFVKASDFAAYALPLIDIFMSNKYDIKYYELSYNKDLDVKNVLIEEKDLSASEVNDLNPELNWLLDSFRVPISKFYINEGFETAMNYLKSILKTAPACIRWAYKVLVTPLDERIFAYNLELIFNHPDKNFPKQRSDSDIDFINFCSSLDEEKLNRVASFNGYKSFSEMIDTHNPENIFEAIKSGTEYLKGQAAESVKQVMPPQEVKETEVQQPAPEPTTETSQVQPLNSNMGCDEWFEGKNIDIDFENKVDCIHKILQKINKEKTKGEIFSDLCAYLVKILKAIDAEDQERKKELVKKVADEIDLIKDELETSNASEKYFLDEDIEKIDEKAVNELVGFLIDKNQFKEIKNKLKDLINKMKDKDKDDCNKLKDELDKKWNSIKNKF